MRVEGWPEILAANIESVRETPFSYGSHDCCLFAADAVAAITGIDYAASVRGYTSKEQALAIIASFGSMRDMVTAITGVEPVHPSRAHRGDFVLGRAGDEEWIGICIGRYFLGPAEGKIGLVFVPMSLAIDAWRIE